MSGKNVQNGNKLKIAERRTKVASLYASGASYREIADHLSKLGDKVSKSTVENDVKAVFGELNKQSLDSLGAMRAVSFTQLRKLIMANNVRAMAGDVKAGELMRKCINDINELYSLKLPQTIDHKGTIENIHVGITLDEWKKQQAERRAEAARTAALFAETTDANE